MDSLYLVRLVVRENIAKCPSNHSFAAFSRFLSCSMILLTCSVGHDRFKFEQFLYCLRSGYFGLLSGFSRTCEIENLSNKSAIMCPRCNRESTAVDRLGYCRDCHDRVLSGIRLRISTIHNDIIHWIGEAEKGYLKTIFYSEDLPPSADGSLKNNGVADGFLASGKNFTRRGNVEPSAAIRQFIQGSKTVCECQGLLVATIYNAVLDVLSLSVFNHVFNGLEITTSVGGPGGMVTKFLDMIGTDEGAVSKGDWVYIANTQKTEMFRLAEKGKVALAAGGWNLICVEAGRTKQYMGLGLANKSGTLTSFSLIDIKKKMIGQYVEPAPILDKNAIKEKLLSGAKISFETPKSATHGCLMPEDVIIQACYRVNGAKLLRIVERALQL